MTRLAAPALVWDKHQPAIETFQAGTRLSIGDIDVDTFTIPHDAADPVGFCFHAEGIKIGLVTDLGYIPESIKFHLRGTHLLMLESNHDLEMLKVGPYPWSVKQRVMGRKGHLSNDSVSDFIAADLDSATATLVLGHLSEHNNHPEIARLVACTGAGRPRAHDQTGDCRARAAHRGRSRSKRARPPHGATETMIARYTRPEMGRIWSDENKYRTWLEVELAAAEALAEMGEVPAEAARAAARARQLSRWSAFWRSRARSSTTSSRSPPPWPRPWPPPDTPTPRAGCTTG